MITKVKYNKMQDWVTQSKISRNTMKLILSSILVFSSHLGKLSVKLFWNTWREKYIKKSQKREMKKGKEKEKEKEKEKLNNLNK